MRVQVWSAQDAWADADLKSPLCPLNELRHSVAGNSHVYTWRLLLAEPVGQASASSIWAGASPGRQAIPEMTKRSSLRQFAFLRIPAESRTFKGSHKRKFGLNLPAFRATLSRRSECAIRVGI
jgi:hypothetical protein